MGGRAPDFSRQEAALQQRYDALSNYRRGLISQGTTELEELSSEMELNSFSDPVKPPVRADREAKMDQANQLLGTKGSTGARMNAKTKGTQILLDALESKSPLDRSNKTFYNPITGKRETLGGDDPRDMFSMSLDEYESTVRNDLTDQLRLQTEPFLAEFDAQRQELINRFSDPTQGAGTTADQQRQMLQDLDRERIRTVGGVLEDITGQKFDFLNLEGGDADMFESFTGQSLDQFLSRTQEDMINTFGEERAQTEMARRDALVRQYDFNREGAESQKRSTDLQNTAAQLSDTKRQQQAQDIRQAAKNEKAEFNRNRAKAQASSGMSLYFQERPL